MPKYTLQLSLINAPVKTKPAARDTKVSFKQLSGCCQAPTKQKLTCSKCGKDVQEKLRGYEVAKNQYVLVTDAELEGCEPESSQVLKLEKFVSSAEIDPMLFDSSFYLEPEPVAHKVYKLILEAMLAEDVYAIAAMTAASREHIAIIRPYRREENGEMVLAMHTMYLAHEINAVPSVNLGNVAIDDLEMNLARQLVRGKTEAFEHGVYRDRYQEAVGKLLRDKQEGKVITIAEKKEPVQQTSDLLAALTASLQSTVPAKPAKEKRKKTA